MAANVHSVIALMVSHLEECRSEFDAAIKAVDPNLQMGAILNHFTFNVDVAMFPVLMVQESQVAVDWIGLQNIAEAEYTLTIWGAVHYDVPEGQQEMLRNLAHATLEALNGRHYASSVNTDDGYYVYFNTGKPPCQRLVFGETPLTASRVVSCFAATWMGNVDYKQRDRSASPPGSELQTE